MICGLTRVFVLKATLFTCAFQAEPTSARKTTTRTSASADCTRDCARTSVKTFAAAPNLADATHAADVARVAATKPLADAPHFAKVSVLAGVTRITRVLVVANVTHFAKILTITGVTRTALKGNFFNKNYTFKNANLQHCIST